MSAAERINISRTIANIAANLPKKLGDRYRVSRFPGEAIPELQVPSSGSAPDIFVYDNQSNALTMIEVKGDNPSYDLPFATSPILDAVRTAYDNYDPTMVLVTASTVPEQLQSELNNDNINVVQFRDLDQTLSDLVTFIEQPKGPTYVDI